MKTMLWKWLGRNTAFRILAAAYEAALIDSWIFHELVGALDHPNKTQGEIYQTFQRNKQQRR